MKNRFNNISSKEWLPFQKSWFLHTNDETLYEKHIRFFIKYDDPNYKPNLYYYGRKLNILKKTTDKNKANIVKNFKEPIQYAIFDLRDDIKEIKSIDEYINIKEKIISLTKRVFEILIDKRFISLIIPNIFIDGKYYPLAWDISYAIASGYSLKDEKIGCIKSSSNKNLSNEIYYILNYRKDANSSGKFINIRTDLLHNNYIISENDIYPKQWEIIKPPPRNKTEILHPAKFPENLIKKFIEFYTNENDNVFDPMSGTGSTQLAAVQLGRNAYGTELSDFFTKLSNERINEYLNPKQKSLFPEEKKQVNFKILNKDVRKINDNDFPVFDYIITSPPYWDMLNMKGAENQAKRKQKGLKINYSDDENDLGNIDDYNEFLDELTDIYVNLLKYLKSGGYVTIIVKNIKKKGQNYPFAWDLARRLSEKLYILPEFFWLQDDINLAPYGYGNTFVSNTFHQYCLNFKKK
jgi:DNA modification methylase